MGTDVVRAIPGLVPTRQEYCAAACDTVLGDCPDWKGITLYAAMQELVTSTTSCVFFGRELGTNPTWISHVGRLPMVVAGPTAVLALFPPIIRPLFKPLLYAPSMYSQFLLKRFMAPILKEDLREYRSSTDKKSLEGPAAKGKLPVTAWLLARYGSKPATEKQVLHRLTNDYLGLSFESTSTTILTIFFIIIELAADPELADLVRKEIKEVAPDGKLPTTHLNELKIMDSVMRESVRFNPFGSSTLPSHSFLHTTPSSSPS